MPYRTRDEEARGDLVEFMNGAVGRNKPRWGSLAAGFAVGYVIGKELRGVFRR